MGKAGMTLIATCLFFSYGLFGLGAQILLFQECLSAFGRGDTCVGLYLTASFLWAVVGIAIAGRVARLVRAEWMLMGCIPVVGLQYALTALAGGAFAASATVVPPFHQVLGWSLLVTLPFGLQMGLLLPMVNRHARKLTGAPIRHLPAAVAAGGFAGGLGTAILLDRGAAGASIFLILASVLCGSAVWSALGGPRPHRSRAVQAVTVTCLLLVLGALISRTDRVLATIVQEEKWSRARTGGFWAGSFATQQGEYLYGSSDGQWLIVRDGRVFETVGDRKQAGRVAAMALAQNYRAQHVLVFGDGLSVCEALLKSPHVKAVDWLTLEPQYMQAMPGHLPQELRIRDERLQVQAGDMRSILSDRPEAYDIVIVNLPSNINGALNRYASVEFFEQVKKALTPTGFLVFGMPGEDDAKELEAGYLNAWIKATLDAVFSQTILVPQERMFFLSAGSSVLLISPTSLATRFSLLENARQILPPEELESVYQPDRAMAVLDACGWVSLPSDALLNSDRMPSPALSHLLLALERSGLSLLKPVRSFLQAGLMLTLIAVALLGLVRLAYSVRTAPRPCSSFDLRRGVNLRRDTQWVLAASAAIGTGWLIVILNACQTGDGPLQSCFGWIVSIFTGGLAIGVLTASKIALASDKNSLRYVRPILWALLGCIVLQTVALLGSGLWINRVSTAVLPVMSIASGILCGVVLALGMEMLQACSGDIDVPVEGAGAAGLLGAAIGALVVSVLLIPLLGLQATLYVEAAAGALAAALVIVTNIQAARPGRRCMPHALLSPLAYGVLGLALCLIVGVHVVRFIERSHVSVADAIFMEQWIKDRRVTTKTAPLAGTANKITYQEVREASRLKGYIFRSEDLTGTVYGYGGPMCAIMFTEPNGTLIDFRLTRSNETPRYMTRIRDWMGRLKGKALFDATPLAGVNAVSGATYSSRAILTLLRNSGRQFAASVLAQEQAAPAAAVAWTKRIDWPLVSWCAAIPLAFGAIYHGKRWSRLLVLAYTAGVSGFWLNRQFSTDHVSRLLGGENILSGPAAALLLLVGIPVLIALIGNIYCGYLCPFGALQELISLVVPVKFKLRLSRPVMGVGRFVKYAVLFALIVTLFAADSKVLLEFDPLTVSFDRALWSEGLGASPGLVVALAVLGVGLFVTRVWCRYLCPTGAFLSLFNMGAWLQRFLPAKKFGRCEFGLTGRDRLDCIHCDRCRHPDAPSTGDSGPCSRIDEGGAVAPD
jgi:NosR/NirI family nitrous oxide reductase transcriptional regulator